MATEPRTIRSVPRVVSACDSCKRRKLKCSGEQPCQRCYAGNVICTYGSTSARIKPLDYIRHLESRVADLEAQLAGPTPRNKEPAAISVGLPDESRQAGSSQTSQGALGAIDTLIGPMDDLLSSFDGSETYHGAFASLNVLRIVRDKCDNLANIITPLSSGSILAEAFSKGTAPSRSEQVMPLVADLPDLAECQRLCYIAIEEALPCHECIDREDFFAQLVKVHAKPREGLDPSDRAFLALVFALLGFAKHFDAENDSTTEAYSNREATLQGLDILRAIVYQVLFLASSCMLSKAYTRLSIGVATALRIGLHVSGPSLGPGLQLPAEQMFRRRQVFSMLYAIDTYIASTLGVPKLFHQVDTDQILPLRDESLKDRGISFARQNPHTPEAESLIGCRILVILGEIHTRRNPFGKGMVLNNNSKTYKLTSQEVASVNAQLTECYESLPPVDQVPPVKRALHAQLAIRHAYAITLMALYRPFLQHLTRKAGDHGFCMEGYAYGSQCITAAMQTIW
ncbi:DNA binding domain-containing protein [Fusarium pseudocircinatum]|uniref:DNA binding domain-containing protein n=1 Tax=Fusarium pseudocircinatum TaxID=56676 RepID=A0A8H5L175_9HYPO|nr:DNA binding domain-containing protein [Fusarium pseudocircinatum]